MSRDLAAAGDAGGVDPATVHTLSELAAAFQRLRGSRSYAKLDKAINPNHGSQRPRLLPPSTLNNLLNGKATPTRETIIRFLTACGLDEQAQALWTAAWERVSTAHLLRPAAAVRVREARPRLLGVHASIQVDGVEGDLPTYVPRDLDADLRTALKAAAGSGGFVLLVGGSSVGKTRTLFEAVRTVLPEWWLIHPDPADSDSICVDADGPAPRTVVWLDELQRYLDAPAALPVGLVRSLIERGAVLVATLWPHEYTSRTQRPLPGVPDLRANDRELLRLSQVVDVPDTFSEAEWCRAEALASDRRIRIALDAADAGLTQVLAAGPELVRWWENASDPYGKAVITAALDARRVGAHAPLTRSFLEAAAVGYVSERHQATAPSDWLDRALRYAVTELHGAASALCPAPAGMGREAGYIVADYLYQHAARTRRTTPLPDVAWRALIVHHQPQDALRLAEAARNRALHRHAESLYRAASESGEPSGLSGLAELRAEQGNGAEAFTLWREAAVTAPALFRLEEFCPCCGPGERWVAG